VLAGKGAGGRDDRGGGGISGAYEEYAGCVFSFFFSGSDVGTPLLPNFLSSCNRVSAEMFFCF